MGDRGNVYIKQAEVYLYTHWGGSDLPHVVQRALQRRQRWDDDAYLARIIFSEMIKGQEAEETGFGICHYMPDNEHPIVVVDCEMKRVGFGPEPPRGAGGGAPGKAVMSWPFESYCKMTPAALKRAWLKAENAEPDGGRRI